MVSSRPLGWKAGFSWTESSTRLSIRIYWLGNGDWTREGLTLSSLSSRAPYIWYECSRWEKDVDYLPMAKPVSQLTTRGSAVTARAFLALPVAGSPHRRSWSLSLEDREKWSWILWDRDTRWFGHWSLDCLYAQAEGGLEVMALLTLSNGGVLGWSLRICDELRPRESAREGATTEVLRWLRRKSHAVSDSSYLVDPASSHMLVSKIKPCMSKYKQICTVKLRMAH